MGILFRNSPLLSPSRYTRVVIALGLTALLSGMGMLLYQVHSTQEVQAQGIEHSQTIQLGSTVKANSSKTYGPIASAQGSWLDINLVANKSVLVLVSSNLTGTIFNYTGTKFGDLVPLSNSTDFTLTVSNPGVSSSSLKGNATLAILSATTQPVDTIRYPLRFVGVGLVGLGAVALLYFALPKEPSRKSSSDLLFP